MMNKLVTAAVVGGAAVAVGVLPAVASAAVIAPTPIPVPTSPAMPTAPADPAAHNPHAPVHRTPSHHRTPGGHHKAPGKSHGKPGTGGGSKAGGGQIGTGKPVAHKPVAHKPVGRKPIVHKPVVGQPIVGKPVVGKPVVGKPVAGQPVAGQPTTAPKPTRRIIGGKLAGDSPWATQVSWDDTGYECSGSAVAAQWVLTARHCVNSAGMTVLIGAKQLGDGTKAVVDDKIVDPTGDLALLHLTEPVSTTYVTLADEDPKVGAINEIYGWGKTDPTSGPADQLKSARVKVTSVDCQDAQGGRAICSTGITGMAFNGDSGGPEMASGVEVGVCSTGDDDAKTQQYASVAANRQWIREVANV
ncbi:MAG TPA: trypsin-like serine protease [Pseudonocardiaceae bacterium]|nr:trypsin-like serine protease [Pseudonocardiaceae bacterium]